VWKRDINLSNLLMPIRVREIKFISMKIFRLITLININKLLKIIIIYLILNIMLQK